MDNSRHYPKNLARFLERTVIRDGEFVIKLVDNKVHGFWTQGAVDYSDILVKNTNCLPLVAADSHYICAGAVPNQQLVEIKSLQGTIRCRIREAVVYADAVRIFIIHT